MFLTLMLLSKIPLSRVSWSRANYVFGLLAHRRTTLPDQLVFRQSWICLTLNRITPEVSLLGLMQSRKVIDSRFNSIRYAFSDQ